jgi:hypothetical protein
VPLGVILKIIPFCLPEYPYVVPYKFPSVPLTRPAVGGPPEPNLYRVVNVCAGNDPDAHSQSAANIIEVPDLLMVNI